MVYMTNPSARIVLVEDHSILREGLRALIDMESDLTVVGEASTGAEGIRVTQQVKPTLVITDLALPGGSGLRTIDELRAVCPDVRVLVLTAYCTDEYIGAALSAGADGYVLKDASRSELLQAIRSVVAGQKYFSEPVSARLVSGYLRRNDPNADTCPRITEREREVLTRIGEQLVLEVADDGVGLEASTSSASMRSGRGVRNLTERAEMTGGQMQLLPGAGGVGTQARIEWRLAAGEARKTDAA